LPIDAHRRTVARMKRLALFALLLVISCASKPRSPMQALAWTAGDWVGSGGGYSAFYERYTVGKDGAIAIEFFDDAAFAKRSGTASIAFEDGVIRYRSGKATWEVSSVTKDEVCFAARAGASNSFCWIRHSQDAWRATLTYPAPRARTVVYELKRVTAHGK
jgi:hypothetical protein